MELEYIGTEIGFCSQTASAWQMVGLLLMVIKIIIPVCLIIIGIITLGKAVISDDDKEIKKGVNKLIKKFIVAVCIFFVPSIISALFAVVNGFDDVKSDFDVCKRCMTSPRGSFCEGKVAFQENQDA